MRFTDKVFLTILLIASLIVSLSGPDVSARLRNWLGLAFAPLGDGGMYFTSGIQKGIDELSQDEISQPQARLYRQESAELKGTVVALLDLNARLERKLGDIQQIQGAFGQSQDVPCELMHSRVIGADPLPYGQMLNLNLRGKPGMDGSAVTTYCLQTDRAKSLPENLAVITTTQLVGRILESGPFTARLQLITDKDFKMNGRILRVLDPANPRMVNIDGSEVELEAANNELIDVKAHGDGENGMVVQIRASYQIRPGDIFQTSGEYRKDLPDDPRLPIVVPVGTVSQVTNNEKQPLLVDIRISPIADLATLRDVYVVYMLDTPPDRRKAGKK